MQIYVGRFNKDDITNNRDRDAVNAEIARTGLKYTKTKLIKRKNEIVAMDIYLTDIEDVDISLTPSY